MTPTNQVPVGDDNLDLQSTKGPADQPTHSLTRTHPLPHFPTVTYLWMYCRYYLIIKDAMVRESYRLGYLSKQRATQLLRVDVKRTGPMYDFFVSCGWVAAQN